MPLIKPKQTMQISINFMTLFLDMFKGIDHIGYAI